LAGSASEQSNGEDFDMQSARVLVLVLVGIVCAPATHSYAAVTAGPSDRAAKTVLWQNPGRVERLDFRWGPGGRAGAPVPPFRFIEEDTSGSNAKVKVRDARGRVWKVKWDPGGEANAEVIATRIAWAAGYFVEPNYFVAHGRIIGAHGLDRAAKFVGSDGSFRDARFELKYPTVAERKDDESWTWESNPFVGTHELNGLKVVMMLVSDFDNKDARDSGRGSNTAVHFVRTEDGVEARYLVTDWGGSMGKWGNFFTREKWDCDGFVRQSEKFVRIKDDGQIEWGFSGQHTDSFKKDVGLDDVRWVMQYVGRITDAQLVAGLVASGATRAEAACYQRALRSRIEQLRRLGAREVAVSAARGR
jgi:hypothetical protein